LLFAKWPAAGRLAREQLAALLQPAPHAPDLVDVVKLAWHNLKICGLPLLLVYTRIRPHGWVGWTIHTAVGANVLVNGIVVGAALGAYGHRIVPYLPHLPIEWAAVALGAGTWFAHTRRPFTQRQGNTLTVALLTAVLLAAGVELYLTPHH
jgi:hypothetical protein